MAQPSGRIKIFMAQANLLVGAIEANATKVISCAKEAMKLGGDIVVFPELTLTGYPPEDLLLRPSLDFRIQKALDRIVDARLAIAIVIGAPQRERGQLCNSALIIESGKLLGVYHKQALPNYQVFDEQRYFASGSDSCVLRLKGCQVGFTICEDLWDGGPVRQASEEGAQILININASPFHLNKLEQRQKLLSRLAVAHNLVIVYVNLIGGQDELVFDGGSMAVDSSGEVCVQAPCFEEHLSLVDCLKPESLGISWSIVSAEHTAKVKPLAQVYDALVLGTRDYVIKNGFSQVVVGLSGGIDSALTVAVAADAIGPENVNAVMMPYEYTSELSRSLASRQAKDLGINYCEIPIDEAFEAFESSLENQFLGLERDVTEQNIQARCRGVLLMAISNKKNFLVLTTGNKSEIAVGYSTLYGDMAGGFNVLKDVSKTRVYELACYRNERLCKGNKMAIPLEVIDRAPSAELAPNQLDEDNLPAYDMLDLILEYYIEGDASAEEIIRKGFNKETVEKVLRMVDMNEYKRRQSPPGIRLTERGFGRDRRYPITNGWPLLD